MRHPGPGSLPARHAGRMLAMWSWTGRGVLVGLVGVALLGGCAAQQDHERPIFHDSSKDSPAFSHSHLDDDFEKDTVADFLLPEEREAVKRSGMTGSELAGDPAPGDGGFVGPEQPKSAVGRVLDEVGKVGVVVLQVAVMLGMMVAPLFMA